MTKPRIDISFCWSFPDVTPEAGLPRLRQFGLEGIELWPGFLDAFGAKRWSRALRDNGMRCFQVCPYFNFVAGPARAEQSRRLLDQYLETASLLDCRRIRVFTGPVGGEGIVGARQATAEQWRQSIASLREFADVAASQAVELCLECHIGTLMEDGPSALRLLQSVDRPNLTVNLQLPLRDETAQTSHDFLAPYTTHIHIHNWTKGLGQGDLTFLEDGAFDWLPVLHRLTTGDGRTLCLSIEHADHGARHDPWETARRDGPFLRSLRSATLSE